MEDQQPKVYTPPNTEVKPGNQWFKSWRIIYPILGLVLIVEIIWGFKTLLTPLPKTQSQKLQPIIGAGIFLISPKTSFKVNDTIPVIIKVSTGGHITSGTDLILRFNPKIIEAGSTAFTAGRIYQNFPIASIDNKIGTISISGVTQGKKDGFGGIGELGVINFKAKALGKTTLSVDFKPGFINDSNVIDTQDNKDILEKVSNLNIIIK